MIRRTARAAVAVAICATVGAAIGGFAAAQAQAQSSGGRIVSVSSPGGKIVVVFGGIGLPTDATIDPSSVKLSVDGQDVPATTKPVSSSTQVQRTAVLAIDTSGSMAGEGIAGAKTAAHAFLDQLPPDVRVALVTFDTKSHLRIPATLNRTQLRNAIDSLQASGNTALYDAVRTSVQAAGTTGVRTIVLLTDGHDDGSATTLQQAVSAAKSSRVGLDAVAFRTAASSTAPLTTLAGATGGRVVKATQAAAITQAFAAAAQDIAREVVIAGDLPASLAGKSGTVAVSADAGGQVISDDAFTSFGSLVAPTPAAIGPRSVTTSTGLSSAWAVLAAVLVFVGLAAILAVAVSGVSESSQQAGVRRRLSVYTLTGRVARQREEEQVGEGGSTLARSAVELAGRVVQRSDFESGLARRLDAAGLPLRPAEWLLIHVGIALGLGLVLLLATGGGFLAALIGVALGVIGPLVFLNVKEQRRRNAFLSQLPDTLQLISGGLSAGYSLPQAVDTVVKEGAPVIATEFNRALVEARLGMPIEDALEGIAQRMRSRDFDWVVMAIRIQREVGGNLSEVLNTVADTLRDRERIRRQVDVLSAEGRLSAVILGALPLVFGMYLVLVRPEYIKVLWTDAIGITLLVVGATLLIIGGFWLRKVVKVEV